MTQSSCKFESILGMQNPGKKKVLNIPNYFK